MAITASSLLTSLQQGADHHGLSHFSSYLQPFYDSQSSSSLKSLTINFEPFLNEALDRLPALLRKRDLVEERDNELLDIYLLLLDCFCRLLPEAKPDFLLTSIHSLCDWAINRRSKRPEAYLRIMALVEQVQPWIRLLDHEAAKRKHLRFLRPLYKCAAILTRECRSFDCDLVSRFYITLLRECASCSFNDLIANARKICSRVDLNWDDGPSIFLDMLRITLELSLCECKDQDAKGVTEFLDFVSSTCYIVYDAPPNFCKLAFDTLNDHVQKFVKLCYPVGQILSLYSAALYFKSTIPIGQTSDNTLISSYATTLSSQFLSQSLIASVKKLSICFSEKKGGDGNASGLFLAYLDALGFLCWVLLPCAQAGWSHFCSEGKYFPNSSNWSNISRVLQEFCSSTINAFSLACFSMGEGCAQWASDQNRSDARLGLSDSLKDSFVPFQYLCILLQDSSQSSVRKSWSESDISEWALDRFCPSDARHFLSLYGFILHLRFHKMAMMSRQLSHIEPRSATTKNNVDKERVDRKREVLMASLVSGFRICFFCDIPYEKCCDSISIVLSSEWVSQRELEDFISKLLYTGPALCQIRSHVRQAPAAAALKLYCEAVLANVRQICHNYSVKSTDISKNIKETISDGYKRIGSTILLFHERHPGDITSIADITVCTLFEMSLVDDLHGIQSDSFSLIKEWVMVLCKEYNDADKRCEAPFLYHLLLKKKDKPKWPRMSLGRIIEKELQVYQQLESRYPDLCINMQVKVIEALLEDLCNEKDYFMEKSRILVAVAVAKARALRASGVEGLKVSLDCLSVAISLLRDVKSDSCKGQALVYHQLATAYCLHAWCAQEYKLNFKVILEDIDSALDLWLSIDMDYYPCSDGDFELVATNMVPMLCSLIDLLSIKGCYKLHSRICKLMAKIFKNENIPVVKLFALLFSDRRLGHTHCGVQIDVEFISDALQNYDASAHLTKFWGSCLEAHNPSLSMFAQSLLLNCLVFPEVNEKAFKKSLQCKIGIKEIKQIASSLISDPKQPSRSFFIAGYLFYDLSQRLLSEGKLFEALSYAKEALNLRKKLLHWKLKCSLEKPDVPLHTRDLVATKTWTDFTRADAIVYSFLSPWIVLRCYLESTFQVGSIYESIGNGAKAESLFQTGKEMSDLQALHSFEITFASSLGQLYRKQQLWDKAESELRSAQKLLEESEPALSCQNCKMFLETTVNLQLGDLLRSRLKNRSLEDALCTYQSAFDKLDHHELEFPEKEEAETNEQLNSTCKFCMLLNKKASNSDTKKLTRTTRARSCKTSTVTKTKEEPATEFNNLKKMGKKPSPTCNGDVSSCKRVCWACQMNRALESGSLTNLLHLGVEFRRSSFLLLLQLKIARTLGAQGEKSNVHYIHSLYRKCVFLLFSKSPGANSSEIHVDQLMELITDEHWKALSINRALLLYNMSHFMLKDPCYTLANFQKRDVLTWLLKAFIFSREFPLLLQKVSRLLASTLILSTVDRSISLPLFREKSLSLNHWASYFHQASISTSLDSVHQCAMNKIPPNVMAGATDETYSYNSKFLRFPFENISLFEEHVECFFKNLPDVPIICISMICDDYPSRSAWVMLSKLDSTNEPITVLLPAEEIKEEQHVIIETCKQIMGEIQQTEEWPSPWGHTVLDHVAPSFKLLMKANSLSPHVTVNRHYWTWRTEINRRLDLFLKNINESWFGPWGCLLKGYPINNQHKELLVPTLINHLKSLNKSEVNPSLVKAILGGSESLVDAEACISQLISYGGSFGHGRLCGEDRFSAFLAYPDLGSEVPESIVKILKDAFRGPMPVNREPVIFVLDTDVQMLPWESLPRLRRQEVYRMPSIGSIFITLDRNYQSHKEKEREEHLSRSSYFPKVDPSDTYYLLNPDGDLNNTEDDFKPWLEELNFKGTTGVAQASEELGLVLRNHDMFFYFGHGNGTNYISTDDIEKLEIRAAVLLMGCSSGKLKCRGSYAAEGVPLSYLFAGSPAVIANLWDIGDRDIDRFSKAVVNPWLQNIGEEQLVSCSHCTVIEKPSRGRGKKTQVSGHSSNRRWCMRCATKRIASSIAKARKACKFDMLTGAAPVCYGVPTILKRKS